MSRWAWEKVLGRRIWATKVRVSRTVRLGSSWSCWRTCATHFLTSCGVLGCPLIQICPDLILPPWSRPVITSSSVARPQPVESPDTDLRAEPLGAWLKETAGRCYSPLIRQHPALLCAPAPREGGTHPHPCRMHISRASSVELTRAHADGTRKLGFRPGQPGAPAWEKPGVLTVSGLPVAGASAPHTWPFSPSQLLPLASIYASSQLRTRHVIQPLFYSEAGFVRANLEHV